MIEIVGLVAAACILAASIPQVVALIKHGGQGVSLGSWSLLLATSLVWCAYGVRIESPSTVIGNAAGVVAFGVVVGMLLRNRLGTWWPVAAMVPAAVALGVAAWLAPLGLTAVAAVLLGFTLALPQLVESYGTWRRRDLSEVALGAWRLLFTGQLLWLVYGVIESEWAIVIVNVAAATASAGVLLLETRNRRALAGKG
ncbi:MAG: hypothetical protein QG597_2233 [Actinomycetota bacterium]|nr:hypothetical protein [Actinomycetota bacterium]